MSKIGLILWAHSFLGYSLVRAQNRENNDDISFEPVQARIPQNVLKSYEITVNFRARTNVRNVRISDFEKFFANYYSSVYSTIGVVPTLRNVQGPDGGNSSFSASIDETTPITVSIAVPGKHLFLFHFRKQRKFSADSINRKFGETA